MKKKPKSKKRANADIAKKETLGPLRYSSKEDIDFVWAAIHYFHWCFSGEYSTTKANITDWWRQRIVCLRNKDVKNKDEEGWFPDSIKRKCFIETYFIEGETKKNGKKGKKIYTNSILPQ